jgi:hypothetical protein
MKILKACIGIPCHLGESGESIYKNTIYSGDGNNIATETSRLWSQTTIPIANIPTVPSREAIAMVVLTR